MMFPAMVLLICMARSVSLGMIVAQMSGSIGRGSSAAITMAMAVAMCIASRCAWTMSLSRHIGRCRLVWMRVVAMTVTEVTRSWWCWH